MMAALWGGQAASTPVLSAVLQGLYLYFFVIAYITLVMGVFVARVKPLFSVLGGRKALRCKSCRRS